MRLLLFNPETEYALASGASFYTPPASVEELRRGLQLLPEAWATPDDLILVDDPDSLNSKYGLVGWNDLKSLFLLEGNITIEPWGWNAALIRRLRDAGVPEESLPSKDRMDRIRSLAHRRTTIALNSLWNKIAGKERSVDVPRELTTEADCMAFLSNTPGCWFKAPWSSSGRGVINTGADMSSELTRQWCHGILRRQGSVMAETGADRIADFATEWRMERGEAHFMGLSSFRTSNRGKYITNDVESQADMRRRFNSLSSTSIDEVVPMQKNILEEVAGGYEGPCGVDMLIERNGSLRPFVELNLRMTMGMLPLIKAQNIPS